MSNAGHSGTGSQAGALRFVHEEPGYLLAHIDNIFVSSTSVQATAEQARHMSIVVEQLAAAHSKLSSIALVQWAGGLPNAEARVAFEQIAKVCVGKVTCTGVMIRGEGFGASALRGLITGVLLIRPQAYKVKVALSFEQLVDWLCPLHEQTTGVRIEPAGLLSALHQVASHPLARARDSVKAP